MTLVVLATFTLAAAHFARTYADVDLWGHLRFGGDIVAARDVPRVDPYSFTSDRPWINHEWLSEVLMYAALAKFGIQGLVLTKLALVLSTLGILAWQAARDRTALWARALLLGVAGASMLPRAVSFRPQVTSLVLFALLLALIRECERSRNHRWLWILPVIFALWVNLHGGWIVGGAVLASWVVWQAVAAARAGRRLPQAPLAVGVASLFATLLNPYGAGMWTFLWDTVDFGRHDVRDWLPIYSGPSLWIPWLLVWAVWFAAVSRKRERPSAWALLTTAGLGLVCLRVGRIDAFFGLAVSGLLAPSFAVLPRGQSARSAEAATPSVLGRLAVTCVAAGVMVWPAVGRVRANLDCLPAGTDRELPEPEAVEALKEVGARGRILMWFDYGEYAIWHLAPDIKVSMDGRRETVYSEAVIRKHLDFYFAPAAHADLPERLGADLVWLPNRLKAARPLEGRGWRPMFQGPMSTIWTRTPRPLRQTVAIDPSRRCFPGP